MKQPLKTGGLQVTDIKAKCQALLIRQQIRVTQGQGDPLDIEFWKEAQMTMVNKIPVHFHPILEIAKLFFTGRHKQPRQTTHNESHIQ